MESASRAILVSTGDVVTLPVEEEQKEDETAEELLVVKIEIEKLQEGFEGSKKVRNCMFLPKDGEIQRCFCPTYAASTPDTDCEGKFTDTDGEETKNGALGKVGVESEAQVEALAEAEKHSQSFRDKVAGENSSSASVEGIDAHKEKLGSFADKD